MLKNNIAIIWVWKQKKLQKATRTIEDELKTQENNETK